jgi:hypothetical protein
VFSNFEYFSMNRLYEVAALGGPPKLLMERADDPRFLPIPPQTLIVRRPGQGIVALNADTIETEILADGRYASFSPSGHILYVDSAHGKLHIAGPLFAKPVSVDTFEPLGTPIRIAEDAVWPSVSEDGTLVYVNPADRRFQLVWLDRNGDELGVTGEPKTRIRAPAISPDGRSVAVYGSEGDRHSIWIYDIQRSISRRLMHSSDGLFRPIWSFDGSRIAYRRKLMAHVVSATPGGEPEELMPGFPCDYSRDGTYLIYQKGRQLWLRKGNEEPAAFTQTRFLYRAAKISPDSRFVAYSSRRSGREEVLVQPFPNGGEECRVSLNGGTQPRWGADGKELFYVAGDTLYAVPIRLTPQFSPGSPKALFRHPGLEDPMPEQQYDVAADGQRFLVVKELVPGSDARPSIQVVQNWYAAFRDEE